MWGSGVLSPEFTGNDGVSTLGSKGSTLCIVWTSSLSPGHWTESRALKFPFLSRRWGPWLQVNGALSGLIR